MRKIPISSRIPVRIDTPIPNTAAAVTAGAGKTLIMSQRLPRNLPSWLYDFGNSIQFPANSNFAHFDLYLDGHALPNFFNISSSIAPSTQPRHYFRGIPLGEVGLIEVYGTLDAGAPNTPDTFSVQATIVSGDRPDV